MSPESLLFCFAARKVVQQLSNIKIECHANQTQNKTAQSARKYEKSSATDLSYQLSHQQASRTQNLLSHLQRRKTTVICSEHLFTQFLSFDLLYRIEILLSKRKDFLTSAFNCAKLTMRSKSILNCLHVAPRTQHRESKQNWNQKSVHGWVSS